MTALTQEQVAVALAKLREKQLDKVPGEARPIAETALRGLETHAGDLAIAGTDLTVRVLSWWDAFGEDLPPEPVGREAGLAAMQGAGDRMVASRDLELEAAKRTRDALLATGKDVLKVAVPLLLHLALP